jgi:hypothetical protein
MLFYSTIKTQVRNSRAQHGLSATATPVQQQVVQVVRAGNGMFAAVLALIHLHALPAGICCSDLF